MVRGSNTGLSSLAKEHLLLLLQDLPRNDPKGVEDRNLDKEDTLFLSPVLLVDFSSLLFVFLILTIFLLSPILSFLDQERTFMLTGLCNDDD